MAELNAPETDAKPVAPQLLITPLLDEEHLRVWQHEGTSERLVVCFSGVGPEFDESPPYEFASIASGAGKDWVLYIADPKRTWLNAPGLIEEIVVWIEKTATQIGASQVVTMGHSMGAYSACVISSFTPVDVVVAFSPQVSVDPEVVPDETRWIEYRERLSEFRIRHVEDHIAPDTQYFVFYGRQKREKPQRTRFPKAENIETLLMRRTHHNTAQRLKAKGLLDVVTQAAFDRRIFRVRRLIRRNYN